MSNDHALDYPAAGLARAIARYAERDGTYPTDIDRLSLIRASYPNSPVHTLHEPALCLVAQGKKHVYLADQMFAYDPAQYLVVAIELPITGQIVEATPEAPYLCLRLELDPATLLELMATTGLDPAPGDRTGLGLALSPVTPELLGAAIRLVELLFAPQDLNVLGPMVEREVLYRLLTGAQAHKVQQIARADSRLQRVNRAISVIKEHYRESLSIASLATAARMSPSALHQHFRAVTSSSPRQFQKRLQLQEARRLMLSQGVGAADAGFLVGYDSPSQFSREYRRLFGAPPRLDAEKLRAHAPQNTADTSQS